ncbi:hypothetical protein B4110_2929 [Parageobacillus toebii]|uniref:Uncharacterized protein n=1 Tax=Parageobacillus toebii TaxID=153151 RepID=A0A150MSW8_9BACL|nr:hypothetical protein B4110_2929 [Parageobacillus toebii]
MGACETNINISFLFFTKHTKHLQDVAIFQYNTSKINEQERKLGCLFVCGK